MALCVTSTPSQESRCLNSIYTTRKLTSRLLKKPVAKKGHTHYVKDEPFVQQGYVGKYLGVVESGYFKYVTLTSSGDEAVVGFAFEGEIVADYYNSFNGLPSEISIKAGSEAEVSQIRTAEARERFMSGTARKSSTREFKAAR